MAKPASDGAVKKGTYRYGRRSSSSWNVQVVRIARPNAIGTPSRPVRTRRSSSDSAAACADSATQDSTALSSSANSSAAPLAIPPTMTWVDRTAGWRNAAAMAATVHASAAEALASAVRNAGDGHGA